MRWGGFRFGRVRLGSSPPARRRGGRGQMPRALRLAVVALGRLVLVLPPAGQAVLAAGTWSLTGSMTTARAFHTATLLPNGQVLVAGGANSDPNFRKSTELYDPA